MSNIAWRNLIRGTVSVLFAVGISTLVLADEASDEGVPYTPQTESADAIDLSDPVLGDVFASETYTLDLYPYHPKNLQIQDSPKHNFLTTRDSTAGEDHRKWRMSKPKSKRALTNINLYYFSSNFCSGTILFL